MRAAALPAARGESPLSRQFVRIDDQQISLMATVLEKVLLPAPLGPQIQSSLDILIQDVRYQTEFSFQYDHRDNAGYSVHLHQDSLMELLFAVHFQEQYADFLLRF